MSAISNTSSGTSSRTSSTNAYSAFTSEDFLEVMFAGLSNQDPTKPTDSQALIEQLGLIRNIESDLALTENLEAIGTRSEISAASSLLGKFAEGRTSSGATVHGYVDSVSITREGTKLNLSTGYQVDFDSVTELIDPALVAQEPADDADGADDPNPAEDPDDTTNTPTPQPSSGGTDNGPTDTTPALSEGN